MSLRTHAARAARAATAPRSPNGADDDPKSFIDPTVTLKRASQAAVERERERVWDGTPTHEVAGMLISADGRTVRYEMKPRSS